MNLRFLLLLLAGGFLLVYVWPYIAGKIGGR